MPAAETVIDTSPPPGWVQPRRQDRVRRRAEVFWRAGPYEFERAPPYEMSPAENREAVEAFEAPALIHCTHHGSPLDGKLGEVVGLFPAAADFSLLGLESDIPPWLDALFRDAQGNPLPMKVSATWDRASKRLKNVALVNDPRIPEAALFEAAFAATGDPALDPSQQPPPTAPDPARTARLVVTGPPDALAALRVLADRMGLACEDGPAEESDPPPPATPNPGVAPMSKETPPGPTVREKELAAEVAGLKSENEALRGQVAAFEARFAAQEERLAALEKAQKEAIFAAQEARFEAEAVAFAREVADRIVPYQRADLLAEYAEAAKDDLLHPAEARFSEDGGLTFKTGTRVDRLKARYRARPKHNLTAELMPDREGAYAEFGHRRGPDPTKANPETVNKLLAAGEIGRAVLRDREREAQQKNGRA